MFHLHAPKRVGLLPVAIATIATLGLTAAVAPQTARASSHSDAPLIKLDPQANLTDVYAFVGTKFGDSNTRVLNVVVNVHPFCEPGDGAIYDKFSDDAIYSINITNPSTGAVLSTYNFQFTATAPNGQTNTSTGSAGYKNLDTILSYGRGTTIGSVDTIGSTSQNYTQGYTVSNVTSSGTTTTLGTALSAPPNVGKKTTPLYNDSSGRAISGATTEGGLDSLTRQAVTTLPGGAVVFAGSRDDSFFSDIPAVFDLLEPRVIGSTLGQGGGGVDGFKGFNVLTYAIQIPLSSLPGPLAYSDAFFGASQGVGVFASVSRPRITLRSATGPNTSSGPFIQVNRLGNPLFNEGLVALRDKDNFNRNLPVNDAANGYDAYARTPELAVLLNAVYGTTFQTNNRTDLVAVFIPDVLRVNTTTGPARLAGTTGFSRLGFIGSDTLTTSTGGTTNGGWPNGRRFGDDVVDIALTAIASGPSYSTVTVVGDNVPANDTVYNGVFPYAATPNSGSNNQKDSVPAAGY